MIFVGIFNSISPTERKLKEELNRRKIIYESTKANFENLVKQHNNPLDLSKYNAGANKMTSLINDFKGLPNEFETKKKKVEETDYNLQYENYLKRFDIRNFGIPSFGPAKKQLIYTNGIRTAADINKLNRIKITGIGPANIHILQTWQRQMGTGFSYVPNYTYLNQEISSIGRAISEKKQKLEIDIKDEHKTLHYLKANILSSVMALKGQYDALGSQLNQQEIDYTGFKTFAKV